MRLPGANAIDHAAGTAMMRPTTLAPIDSTIEFVGEFQIVRPLLNLEIVLERPVEEQEFRRHRDRVELAS